MSIPFKSGLTRQIVMGPNDANCPNASSIKNKGSPTRASISKYGIKKAPGDIYGTQTVLFSERRFSLF